MGIRLAWKKFRHEVIFPKQLEFGVFFLRKLGNEAYCQQLQRSFDAMPADTLGYRMGQLLKEKELNLVPFYVEHDLKHALLGYSMEAEAEMKMQAFMTGNSGISWFHTTISLLFIVWVPEVWQELRLHYELGKRIKPIRKWKAEEVVGRNLEELREEIGWKPEFIQMDNC